jgi:Icc-related predicted phosphoesterase
VFTTKSVGSQELRDRVRLVKPKLHVFGHIHSCSGAEVVDGTLFVNAAILDHNHMPNNFPKRVELKVIRS